MVYMIICIFGGWLHNRLNYKEKFDSEKIITLVFSGCVGFIIAFIVSPAVGDILPKQTSIDVQEISSLSNDFGITEKEAYVLVEPVEGNAVSYTYLTEGEDGKKIEQIRGDNSNNIFIKNEDYKTCVKFYKYGKFKSKLYWLFAFNRMYGKTYKTEFYIPEGSVIK